jgi:hypothetical protein
MTSAQADEMIALLSALADGLSNVLAVVTALAFIASLNLGWMLMKKFQRGRGIIH